MFWCATLASIATTPQLICCPLMVSASCTDMEKAPLPLAMMTAGKYGFCPRSIPLIELNASKHLDTSANSHAVPGWFGENNLLVRHKRSSNLTLRLLPAEHFISCSVVWFGVPRLRYQFSADCLCQVIPSLSALGKVGLLSDTLCPTTLLSPGMVVRVNFSES